MIFRPLLAFALVLQTAVNQQPGPDAVIRQLLRDGGYAKAEALARQQVAAAERDHGASALSTGAAIEQLVEALWRGGKASAPETRSLAERAVTIKEAILGSDHVDVADPLMGLASVLAERGDNAGARPVLERALRIRETNRGADHLSVAAVLNDLGLVLSALSEYPAAKLTYERALRIREAASPDSLEVAGTLNNLASLLKDTGEYTQAEPLYLRSLSIREQLAGVDSASVTTALHGLAFLRIEQGRYDEARTLYDRIISIRERIFAPGHPEIAKSLTNLAIALAQAGANDDARALFVRSHDMLETALGPTHPDVISARNNLGVIAQRMGDFVTARTLAEHTLAERERTLPAGHRDIGEALHNLGAIHREIGDYEMAIALYRRALAIRETTLGPEHTSVASTLNNLAIALNANGAAEEARATFARAIAILEKRVDQTHLILAQVLSNYATALQNLKQFGAAETTLLRALAIYEKAYSPRHPSVAAALDNLADNHHRTGEHEKARDTGVRAFEIRSASLGLSHPQLTPGLVGLARESLELGDRRRALEYATQAETIGREHLRLTISTLPERQALTAAASRSAGLDVLMSLAADETTRTPEVIRTAFDAVIRSRAIVLDEMGSRHQAVWQQDVNDARRAALTGARRRLANLMVRGPGRASAAQYRSLLDEARREHEVAERQLAEGNVAFRRESTGMSAGYDTVTASLPERVTLVSFVRYGQQVVAAPGQSVTERPSYFAFIARRGADPVGISLGDAAAIDTLVSRWRRAAQSARSEQAYRQVGVELRQRIWDSIAPALVSQTLVIVVPDGELSLVNLAALPDGNRNYVIERGPIIHYASAERDVVVDRESLASGSGLLVVGGAAFDADPAPTRTTPAAARSTNLPACPNFGAVRFSALAGTAAEAREIAALFKNRADVIQLSGLAATEAAVKQQAAGKAVLHLATHGFFLDGRCSAQPDERGVGGVNAGSRSLTGHPLRLSGLALSGANRRGSARADDEDGIITAEEVASMDLSRVQWAVLSACDTGVGEVRAGEGVLGLRRAFRVAGTRTVIMSLWSVQDEATRLWMRELYKARFTDKLGTAEALRQASVSRLTALRAAGRSTHPFYWGAFVASGDWR